MKEDLIYKTCSAFDSVCYIEASDSWTIIFANDTSVIATGFWRLYKANEIVLVSRDHGQQFGKNMMVDLVEELNRHFTSESLTEIKVDRITADLTLYITSDLKLDIFISSSGFESYEFVFQGKRHIGMGSGELGVVEISRNHQNSTVRIL